MRKLSLITEIVAGCVLLALTGCIDHKNDNTNGQGPGGLHETDEQEATTYNKTRDDMADSTSAGTSPDKRIPKDPVERQSKGNAASE